MRALSFSKLATFKVVIRRKSSNLLLAARLVRCNMHVFIHTYLKPTPSPPPSPLSNALTMIDEDPTAAPVACSCSGSANAGVAGAISDLHDRLYQIELAFDHSGKLTAEQSNPTHHAS